MKESGTNIASSFRYVTARRRCRGRSAISKPRASRFGERSRKGGQAMTGKIARTSMLGASCVGILLGAAALMWSPMVQAQSTFSPVPQVQSSPPAKIDRTLPGSKKGVATKAEGGTVWIDGRKYVLAPGALLEKGDGSSMQVSYLKFEGMNFEVEYWLWLGPDPQITQMIVKFVGG